MNSQIPYLMYIAVRRSDLSRGLFVVLGSVYIGNTHGACEFRCRIIDI